MKNLRDVEWSELIQPCEDQNLIQDHNDYVMALEYAVGNDYSMLVPMLKRGVPIEDPRLVQILGLLLERRLMGRQRDVAGQRKINKYSPDGRPVKLTAEMKRNVLKELRAGTPVAEVASGYEVHPSTIYRIRKSGTTLRTRK